MTSCAGWTTASLSESCLLITDGTHHSPANGPSGDFRYVTAKNIRRSGLDLNNITYVDAATHAEIFRRCPVRNGDLLYIKDGATTGIAIINPLDEPFSLLSSVALIRPDPRLLSADFLCHLLNSPELYNQMIGGMTGSAIRRLTLTTISRQIIPIPPLPEQRRIVAKIDSLSAKSKRARDHLDHIPRLVEKYKQAILAAAFRGELTREWRRFHLPNLPTFDRSRTNQRIAELGNLPESWCWTEFAEIGAVTGGLTKNTRRASLPRRVPYLRVANVYANELRLDDIAEIGCTDAEFEKTRLEKGDLLIVEGNGSLDQIGRLALWDGEISGCSHQNHIIRGQAGPNALPAYLLYWLMSPLGRQAIEAVASSSSGLHTLSISKVRSLPIPICSVDEQRAVTQRIETAFAWIGRLSGEAGSARKLINHFDQAILAKAFRGELVPQDLRDEPAGVLLERIRAARPAASLAQRRAAIRG